MDHEIGGGERVHIPNSRVGSAGKKREPLHTLFNSNVCKTMCWPRRKFPMRKVHVGPLKYESSQFSPVSPHWSSILKWQQTLLRSYGTFTLGPMALIFKYCKVLLNEDVMKLQWIR